MRRCPQFFLLPDGNKYAQIRNDGNTICHGPSGNFQTDSDCPLRQLFPIGSACRARDKPARVQRAERTTHDSNACPKPHAPLNAARLVAARRVPPLGWIAFPSLVALVALRQARPRSAGGTNHPRFHACPKPHAPLNAARLVAARRVPPLGWIAFPSLVALVALRQARPRSAGGTNHPRFHACPKPHAPLNAARLVAARRVPPLGWIAFPSLVALVALRQARPRSAGGTNHPRFHACPKPHAPLNAATSSTSFKR